MVPLGSTVDVDEWPAVDPQAAADGVVGLAGAPTGGFYTLQIDFDPSELLPDGSEFDPTTLAGYYWNDDVWELWGRASNIDQSMGEFVLGEPTDILGDWGINLGAYYIWANVDHASTFCIAGTPLVTDDPDGVVPEPATLTMLALGGLAALRRKRR